MLLTDGETEDAAGELGKLVFQNEVEGDRLNKKDNIGPLLKLGAFRKNWEVPNSNFFQMASSFFWEFNCN